MKHIKIYEDFLNEEATTSWSSMMKGVKAGDQGPWSIVAIQDRKVVGQSIDIRMRDLIPARYEALKREHPRARLHIEDGGGRVVWDSGRLYEAQKQEIDVLELGGDKADFSPENLELTVWYDGAVWDEEELEKAWKGKDPEQAGALDRVLKPKRFKIDPSGKHEIYPDELCIVWKLKKR